MAGWCPRGPGASEHCGCIGPGCGFQFRGGGFAVSRLTFHQLRGSSVARSQLWKASLARGRRWMAGLAGAPGGLCETWRSSVGPGARPPAAVRTQRPPRLHVRGKTRESRCGCPEEGTCQLCANLGSPGRDPFYMCWTFVLHRVLPTRVPTQSCGAARRSPRSPSPARATHNVDSLFFFFPDPDYPLSPRESRTPCSPAGRP